MREFVHAKAESALLMLRRIAREFAPATLSNGLGAEGMLLTDLIFTNELPIEVFTLDTGRLPNESYALMEAIALRYGVRLRVLSPDSAAVESYVKSQGVNGFYSSLEQRRACCRIRKVEPLKRALAGKKAWVTGIRRSQSVTRADVRVEEYDAEHGLMKFNPLADWSNAEVWAYIRSRQVPHHALHDRGYPSIGCAPCTRAVAPGEDPRAGRWWWERPESKECGLHVRPDGRLVREEEPA